MSWNIAAIQANLTLTNLTGFILNSTATGNYYGNAAKQPQTQSSSSQGLGVQLFFSAATAGTAILQQALVTR